MEEGDMEMNESPLLTESDNKGNASRMNLMRLILFFQSTEIFIAGARAAASRSPSLSSSQTTAYSVLSCTDAKDNGSDLEKGRAGNGAAGPGPDAKDGQDLEIVVVDDADGLELQRQKKSLKKILKEKNLQSLNHRHGGVAGVADTFNSHLETGISDNSEEISKRKMVEVSQNWALADNYFHFLKKSCKSWNIVLLILAGVLSLAFGIKEEGLQSGWLEGAIEFATTFVLILFSSIRNWWGARTAKNKSQKEVDVVRGGKEVLISESDLVYGDLVCLKAGSLIPADGLFVSGEGLVIDDGGTLSICNEQNPFLFYGSRLVKGSAKMLVTSEGMDDMVLGEMMREDQEWVLVQKKTNIETIDKLSKFTEIGGILISILICVVAFLRFMTGKKDDGFGGNRPDSKGVPTELEMILHSLRIIFTESKGNARVLRRLLAVSLVGLMEGIPFVVAIAINNWNSKILSGRASAKDALTCVKMAKVTTICTENVGWLKDHRIEIGEVYVHLNSDVSKAVLHDGIGTSTLNPHSKMDQPLLCWAEENIGVQRETSKKCNIVENNGEVNPFKKPCGVLVERSTESGKEFDVHFKGPADCILDMCSFYYDETGKMEAINEEKKKEFTETMEGMKGKHLEVIAYASKSTDVQELQGEGLTFLGMFGLKYTFQQETRDRPVASLVASGIKIILFSQDDDVEELKTVSRECGISETDAEVLTGDELQQCITDEEMFEKLESIKVVGKCNSKLKRRIVRCLRSKDEVVAVVGERSGDAPIMKEADIGLAIKTEYSEITTESAANLIIMKGQGSFSLLIDMIICGRIIVENVKKFIQVEVIMTISSLLINFISAVSSGDTPLSAIQSFWIYLLLIPWRSGIAVWPAKQKPKPPGYN